MTYTKDFSVIVPCWRGAIKYLPKLFDSIPEKEGIEIIVVDNSKEPVSREEIRSDRDIVFLHAAPERHAGGSRNDGMAIAKGKWFIFADADDYFTIEAFDVFYSKLNTDAEIVYTCMGGIYEDTGKPSDRGEKYTQRVKQFSKDSSDEMILRLGFSSPCCKMISHDLVKRHKLLFDEIRASNDTFFSLTSGFYAKKIEAVDRVTYIATVNRGSLTQHRDYEVVLARLYAKLKCNQFLKSNGFGYRQGSIMVYLFEARRYKFRQQFEFWKLIIKFKQNPFVGWRRWSKSYDRAKTIAKRDSKYRVK